MVYFRKILQINGSAVDAAISTVLCNGIYNAQSLGVGGGFIMTIYERYIALKIKKAPTHGCFCLPLLLV